MACFVFVNRQFEALVLLYGAKFLCSDRCAVIRITTSLSTGVRNVAWFISKDIVFAIFYQAFDFFVDFYILFAII